ncbi:MAG: nucleotidyltransferase [Bdellovibrionales bacterium]|nr:nucleotidyltransferase [Bdellovibrionales bacterium]
MKNLNNLLQLLLESEIEFVLIGGFAGVVHGSTQVTRDLDICAAVNPDGIKKLRELFKNLHPRHRMNPNYKPSFLDEPKELDNVRNIYLETDFGILDVISEVTGVGDYNRLKSQAVEIELFGQRCKVISIEDLIQSKEKMERHKDIMTARELRALLVLKK